MNSMKCPQCGLINWADALACKRCKLPFVEAAPAGAAEGEDFADGGAPPPPHEADAHASEPHGEGAAWPPQQPYTPGHGWSSPYAADATYPPREENALDIDFEVSPFVDASTTIRDTFALSRSQLTLMLKLVLTAIAPQLLLMLAISGHTMPVPPEAMPWGGEFFGNTPRGGMPGGPYRMGGALGMMLTFLFVSYFLRWAVMPGALVYGMVQTLSTGQQPSVFECYRWGLRRSFTTGVAFLLSVMVIVFGIILFIIPGLIWGAALSLVLPIAAVEGVGVFETMRRSFRVTKGNRAAIFWSSFCWTFVIGFFGMLASFGIMAVSMAMQSPFLGSVGVTVVSEVLSATHIVFALVVYLGIAHYGRNAAGGFYQEGGAAAWGPPPAYAAPASYAAPAAPASYAAPASHATPASHAAPNPYAAPDSYAGPQPYAVPHGYSQPAGYYPERPKAKAPIVAIVVACAVVMVSFIGIVAAIAIPNLLASRRAANEGLAVKNMRMISSAQATYASTDGNGSYGTLQDLADARLIPRELTTAEHAGYRYRVRPSGYSFEATATPVSSSMGTRSFFTDETGVIRAADRKGLEASVSDPALGSDTGPPFGGYDPDARRGGPSPRGRYEPRAPGW